MKFEEKQYYVLQSIEIMEKVRPETDSMEIGLLYQWLKPIFICEM